MVKAMDYARAMTRLARSTQACAAFAQQENIPGMRRRHRAGRPTGARHGARPGRRRGGPARSRPTTAFRIASMTKSTTALAILALRDAGRLALDAPLADYVPQFASVAPATRDSAPVTVRHLLTPHGGLRHRRSMGRPRAGHEPGGARRAARDRHAVRPTAGACLRVQQSRLRAARPCDHQRDRRAVPELHPPHAAAAARHDAHHLRRLRGGARRLRLGLSLRRRRLLPRAAGARRRGRRDGRTVDDRRRLRPLPHLSPERLAAARRSRDRAGAPLERARDGPVPRAAVPAGRGRRRVPGRRAPTATACSMRTTRRWGGGCIIPAACRATARTCCSCRSAASACSPSPTAPTRRCRASRRASPSCSSPLQPKPAPLPPSPWLKRAVEAVVAAYAAGRIEKA